MRLTSARAYVGPPPVPKMPVGLVELIEGLTKEVLKNNPTDVYGFCAKHLEKLLEIRDGPSNKNPAITLEQKILQAQEKVRERAKLRQEMFDKKMQVQNDVIKQTNVDDEPDVTTQQELPTSNLKPPVHHEQDLAHASEVEISHETTVDKSLSEKTANQSTKQSKLNIIDVQENNLAVEEDTNMKLSGKTASIELINKEKKHSNNLNVSVEAKNDTCIDVTYKEIQKKSDSIISSEPVTENAAQLKDEIPNIVIHDENVKHDSAIDVAVENAFKEKNASNTEDTPDNNTIKFHDEIQCNENIEDVSLGNKSLEEVSKKDEPEAVVEDKTKELSENIDNNEESIKYIASTKTLSTNAENINIHTEKDLNADQNFKQLSSTESPSDNNIELKKEIPEVSSVNYELKNELQNDEIKPKINIEITAGKENDEQVKADEIVTSDSIHKLEDVNDSSNKTVNISEEVKADDKKVIVYNLNTTDNKDSAINIHKPDENETIRENTVKIITEEENKLLNADTSVQNSTSSDNMYEDSSLVESDLSKAEEDAVETLNEQNNMDLETAAVTIQKVFRTFLFKSRNSTFDDAANDESTSLDGDNEKKEEYYAAANQLNKERRALGITRMDTVLQTVNEEKSLSLSTDDSSTLSSAATTIQAHVRGFLVRNRLNSNKTVSTNSLANSNEALETDSEPQKSKTVLNIHIVPEEANYLSRDESLITSMDLSLDGSPQSSVNLHPLSYDASERRKQLKREDAVQSVTPPSNNSGKLSEESVKDVLLPDDATSINDETDDKEEKPEPNHDFGVDSEVVSISSTATAATVVNVSDHNKSHDTLSIDKRRSLEKMNSDESDVVTPYDASPRSSVDDYENTSKLVHSGEFHDVLLPTRISRSDTTVVRGE